MDTHAQNLVPNHSFENYSFCPAAAGSFCQDVVLPWTCANAGTCDYFNVCCDPVNNISVPANFFGFQWPLTGDAYAGLLYKWFTGGREYIQVHLISPLVAGQWYQLSYYVSMGEIYCPTNRFGAYFSETQIQSNSWDPLDLDPQIEWLFGYIDNTTEWVLISSCYQAQGGEEYIVLGNFYTDAESPGPPGCETGASYYYVDEVSLVAVDAPGELDPGLDDYAFDCELYEIVPTHPGPLFHWSDGSQGPSLTVNTSGVYHVTVSDGCAIGFDSIEVEIAEEIPPVNLPDEPILLCEGESYMIELDPQYEAYVWQDGSTGPEFVITGPGTYSVTLSDGCSLSSDQIEVMFISPPPLIELGPDLQICLGEEITWSFEPSFGDYTWQDGSHNSVYTAMESGEYALTISNICGETSDAMNLEVFQAPEVDLGENEFILCDGNTLVYNLDPGMGSIEWQDGSQDEFYEIFNPGVYSVTITNLCGIATDQVEVFTAMAPLVNLGDDQVICEGDQIVLNSPGTSGIYEWQNGSDDTHFNVSSPGLYSVTVTNECGISSDTVMVVFQNGISPFSLGADFSLCPGEYAWLSVDPQNAQVMWSNGSTSDSILVQTAGTYYVSVVNSCNQQTDSIHVGIGGDPPVVDLPDTIAICDGEMVMLSSNVTGVTYQWNTQEQTSSIVVAQPGWYSVQVSNACGSDMDSVFVHSNGVAPLIELGDDQNLCNGDTIVIIPQFQHVELWLWHNGSVDTTFEVTQPGTVHLEASNQCGIAYDTMQIVLLPDLPPISLGPDTALCEGQSLTLTNPLPGETILWSTGAQTDTIEVGAGSQIYATVTGDCNQTRDTILVESLPSIPFLDLGMDQSLCPGETIVIDPGIDEVEYLWQDGTTDPVFVTTEPVWIVLTISNECGSEVDSLLVELDTDGPQVDLGEDILACEGEVIEIESGISGVDYMWNDGSNEASLNVSVTGTYVLQVSNACGMDADTIMVEISGLPPVVDLGPDTLLCDDAQLWLTPNVDSATSVVWHNGSVAPSFLVDMSGQYYLQATNRCGVSTDTLNVEYMNSPPPFTLAQDTSVCEGETLLLLVPHTNHPWQWSDGSDAAFISIEQPGSYWLRYANECGSVSDTIKLTLISAVPQVDVDPVIHWCLGEVIDIDVTQHFQATYTWSHGPVTPEVQLAQPGVYAVLITSICDEDEFLFEILTDENCMLESGIYIPNVFSPNGDQVNDVFRVEWGSDLEWITMAGQIFDRWGNLVFSAEAIPFEWNGVVKDKPVNPGVFVYKIQGRYQVAGVEREIALTGDVTVVR